MNKKAQVTIFIILAIIIVAAVAGFFIFRDKISVSNIPVSMQPIYNSFLSCLEEDTLVGANILMSQGGYIEMPEFEPGSAYMPFSSQLNFLGNPIPYWYYVSGNNIEKEQIPSKKNMEEELEGFIEQRISECSFDAYYDSGYVIYSEDPKASIEIQNSEIEINLKMDLTIEKGDEIALVNNHDVVVNSKLGKLYDSAIKVYDEEQSQLFLEEYSIDTLRLYAPVDGVELSCSPKVWNAEEVFDDLYEAIEINTMALKSKGEAKDYFVVDLPVNEDVRFLTSQNWPHNFEVNPSEGALMIANPVGNQAGLGVLGFCYVSYHYVYDIKYPVLVQVYDGEEIFQFPMAVIIKGNNPRESLEGEAVDYTDTEFCNYKNTLVEVNMYDSNLIPVQAEISYECFGNTCLIGETSSNGVLESEFPQCINGYIVAKADGFEETKYLYSVIESEGVYIEMDRIYERNVDLKLDWNSYNGEAIISFVSEDLTKTIVYPDTKTVELSEGDYDINVYIYQDSSLELEESTYEECIEMPKSGIGGIVGLTQEKCFEITLPSQIVSSALAGGGKEVYYITDYQLQNSNTIEINAESLLEPTSLDQLQENYMLFETKGLDIFFT
ncbi:hypothetical protein KAI04_01495 [Candidatus Pacearchaeota archaeon]|nr:hypothetical protein [Candidatus Pacearchaeota archaeon]